MVDDMIVFQDDNFIIETVHSFNVTETLAENLDFILTLKKTYKVYSCTVFSKDCVVDFFNQKQESYFWSISSIVVDFFSLDNLLQALYEIYNDPAMNFDDIFIKSL